jgi:alcohol dehydrogenase class IV
LPRFDVVARALTGHANACAEDGVAFIESLVAELAVPGLSSYGVRSSDIPGIVEKAAAASSMKGNPIPLTVAELSEILERAL